MAVGQSLQDIPQQKPIIVMLGPITPIIRKRRIGIRNSSIENSRP